MKVALTPSNHENGWGDKLTLDDFVSHTPVTKLPVPNHLTDTKIFSSKIKKDALVKVDPNVIHFAGFSLRKTQQRKIKICNSSSERQNMHIISPSTKYFSVKYTKPRRFVPGFTMDVTIQFTPDEWRYYYDCIRLHCEGEDNIIIPLHAYPVMDLSGFPEKIVFDTASFKLGKTRKKILSLKSPHPIDFEYKITVLQSHPSFTVRPLSGTVPGEGEALVTVIYNPTEYVTSHMTMQLKVSEFNSRPLISSVMASCVPNPKKKSVKDSDEVYKRTKILDPRTLSLVQMSRKRRTITAPALPADEIEFEGLHFPVKLQTQHAVNSVLMQKAGKMRAKDMRDAVSSTKLLSKEGRESTINLTQMSSRQMKEATFKQELTKDEIEERANHLRWQVHTGSNAPTEEEQLDILREREKAQTDYKYRRRCEPDEEAEVLRSSTFKAMRRTFRLDIDIPEEDPSFDLYNDNPWLTRHRALERFQQAARTILIRRRADKKVKMLRQMIERFQNGEVTQQISAESTAKLQLDVRHPSTPGTPSNIAQLVFSMTAAKVKPFTFPVYVQPDTKDSLTTDELGEVESGASNIAIRTNVPFHHLKVPKQYEMLGYGDSDVDKAARSYVSPSIVQPLRTGADDELLQVAIPPHLLSEDQKLNEVTTTKETDSRTSDESAVKDDMKKMDEPVTSSGLIMPEAMLRNPPRHRMKIFNPFPGMQRRYLPLSHSEVDPDYHLCPFPRYTMLPGAKPYFDDQDIIPEIMQWKKFPSQALAAFSQGGGLPSDVPSPRWSDPFSEALLPMVTPALLSPPPKNSEEPPPDFGASEPPELTPEMIRQEFKVTESEVEAAAKEEQEERGQKAAETTKPVKQTSELSVRLRNYLKKVENMDKKQPKIIYTN